MAGGVTNDAQMKEPLLKERQRFLPKCLVLNIFVLHFFVPVGSLISCDFFFNAPYSRLILSNSSAGVFVIHNSRSNVND